MMGNILQRREAPFLGQPELGIGKARAERWKGGGRKQRVDRETGGRIAVRVGGEVWVMGREQVGQWRFVS